MLLHLAQFFVVVDLDLHLIHMSSVDDDHLPPPVRTDDTDMPNMATADEPAAQQNRQDLDRVLASSTYGRFAFGHLLLPS